MLKLKTLAVIGTLAACNPAHAEFVMLAPAAPQDGDPLPAAAPLDIGPASPEPKQTARESARPTRISPRIPIAKGFGRSVPLAFAVRQIVPQTVKVIYGPAADRNAFVDWQGGRRWTLVLRKAVRPLGLIVSLRRATLRIGRK